MATQFKNIVFVRVDVDDAKDVKQHCGIKLVPTFKFYKDGIEIETIESANEKTLSE